MSKNYIRTYDVFNISDENKRINMFETCYAVFNNIVNTQTQIRINYLIIYTPSEYFGRNSI